MDLQWGSQGGGRGGVLWPGGVRGRDGAFLEGGVAEVAGLRLR